MTQKLKAALILLGVSASITGCGLTHDTPPREGLGLSGALELSCLDQIPTRFNNYLRGQVSNDSEITEPFRCIDQALDTFTTYTRGADTESYQTEELRGFLNRYLLKTSPLSQAFIQSIMELKKTLMGGSTQVITRDEIVRIRRLIGLLGEETLRLKNVVPVIYGAREPNPESWFQMRDQLRASAARIGAEATSVTERYTFLQLHELLGQLNRFLDQGVAQPEPGLLVAAQKNIPLLKGLKALLFGNTTEAIEPGEWPLLMKLSAHASIGYLIWEKRTPNVDLTTSAEGLRLLATLAEVFAGIMNDIPTRSDGKIPLADQTLFRNEMSRYLPKRTDDDVSYRRGIGWGLLAARLLFANEQKDWIVARFRELPPVLRSMAQDVPAITAWYRRDGGGTYPRQAVNHFARLLGQFMRGRPALGLRDFRDAFRFVEPLIEDIRQNERDIPFLIEAKQFLTARQGPRFTASDWQPFLESACEAYAVLWKLDHYVLENNLSWMTDAFQERVRPALISAVEFMKKVANRYPNDTIPFTAFDAVVPSLHSYARRHDRPLPLTPATISVTLRPLVKKLLAGRDTTIQNSNGVSVATLEKIKDLFLRWSMGQSILEATFQEFLRPNQMQSGTVSFISLQQKLMQGFRPTPSERGSAVNDALKTLSMVTRYHAVDEGKLYFPGDRSEVMQRNFRELSYFHLLHTGIRFAGDAYAPPSADGVIRITTPQLTRAIQDFWAFSLETGIVESDDTALEFAESLVTYGNLFMTTSDGNTVATALEAFEMVLHVLSARQHRKEVIVKLKRAGCDFIDAHEEVPHFLPANCTRSNFFQNGGALVRQLSDSMPRLTNEFSLYSNADKQLFLDYLERAMRPDVARHDPYSIEEVKRGFHIIQYVESLFQKLDYNWDGVLVGPEAMRALPIFAAELGREADMSGYQLEALFGYLLVHGQIPPQPNTNSHMENALRSARWVAWLGEWGVKGANNPDIRLNRLKLLRLFAELTNIR